MRLDKNTYGTVLAVYLFSAAEAFAQAFEDVLGRGLRRFSRPWTADELGEAWDEGQPAELLEGQSLP